MKGEKFMKLASNEQILRSWTYASTKQGSERSELKLTVTNKRIVSDEIGTTRKTRQEVPLDAVKSLAFQRETGTGWLLIILGVLLLVVLVGVVLIYFGVKKLMSGEFSFVISTYGEEGTPLEMGVSVAYGGSKKAARLKIKIDQHMAEEIMDTLGAIVVENRAEQPTAWGKV